MRCEKLHRIGRPTTEGLRTNHDTRRANSHGKKKKKRAGGQNMLSHITTAIDNSTAQKTMLSTPIAWTHRQTLQSLPSRAFHKPIARSSVIVKRVTGISCTTMLD